MEPLRKRKPLRLQDYNYSSEGAYFVTICTKGRVHCFGDVHRGIMGLYEIGVVVHAFWQDIPNHFEDAVLDEFVIMPNHVHGILFLNGDKPDCCRGAINRAPTVGQGGVTGIHNPMGKGTLGEIIRWFKGRASFEIHKQHDLSFAWQRSFNDRVIRNENELNRIRQYIRDNPRNWDQDKDNLFWGPR